MKTFIGVVLALVLAALAAPAYAKEPSSYQSLQPYQTFGEGAGHGLALEYVPRDKAQFVALLRDKSAKKRMRAGCEVLVRQMAEVHGLPFEGCEGAAAAIEGDSDYAVVSCKDDMFVKANYLAVTNDRGTAFGVWHRKCLPREQVLLYKGRPLASTMCLNVAIPVTRASTPSVVAAGQKQQFLPVGGPIATCPDVYFLKVNVWRNKAFELPGVAQTHAKEELGQGEFSKVEHVSRKHGGQLRKALAAGQLARSPVTRTFRVSLIMTPESQGGAQTITAEEVLGDIKVVGLYELRFKRTQLEKWDAIRLVAINGDVVSPPRFKGTGVHELRFFNHLPGKTLGEWDNNPVPDCIMNSHLVE